MKKILNQPLDYVNETLEGLCAAHPQYYKRIGAEGRVLVRWSGTEPKLRVMVEGPDETRIGTIAQDLITAAREDVG